MHRLYFCYGEVEMLRGSLFELQSSESSKRSRICSKKLFPHKSISGNNYFLIIITFKLLFKFTKFIVVE